jgi:hypothetical protein
VGAPPKFRFICATKKNADDFFKESALGRSLSFYRFPAVELRLFHSNAVGLSRLYNQAIDESKTDPAILIFIHDDVYLCDFFWTEEISSALLIFDVVGLVGNRRRVPNQPSWAFVDDSFTWDADEHLSGVIAHGNGFPPDSISYFGSPRQEVKLLDGLLLACKSTTLISSGVRFDERFNFHFYDLDFCRQAESRNLKMGTCAISAVHESGGTAGSAAWKSAYRDYLLKWHN